MLPLAVSALRLAQGDSLPGRPPENKPSWGKKKKKKPGHDYLGPAGISSKYAVHAFSADGSDQCAAMHLTDVRSASGGGTLECHECHSCVHCIFMSVDARQSDFEKIDK